MQKENKKNEIIVPSLNETEGSKNTPLQSDLSKAIPNVNLVTEFLQFAKWFATPRHSRKQKTQKDFANEIGVNEDTLSDWKRNSYFWPIVQQFMSEWIKDRIPDVIEGLYNNACNEGKYRDVEAFLKLGGMTNDSKKNKN